MSTRQQIGKWRSRIIYDLKPFNQSRLTAFYRQFVQAGDLCFDLGAHTGNRTKAWSALGAKVVAVEPQPSMMALIQKRFGKNPNVILVEKAVGRIPGTGLLKISTRHPTVSSLSDDWIKTIRDFQPSVDYDMEIEVEVTTLDELIRQFGKPAFIKIDVEGFEKQVLEGLSTPVEALSFEFFPTTPETSMDCIDRLCELKAYKFNWSLVETMKFQAKNWLGPDDMKMALTNNNKQCSGDVYARLIHQ